MSSYVWQPRAVREAATWGGLVMAHDPLEGDARLRTLSQDMAAARVQLRVLQTRARQLEGRAARQSDELHALQGAWRGEACAELAWGRARDGGGGGVGGCGQRLQRQRDPLPPEQQQQQEQERQ